MKTVVHTAKAKDPLLHIEAEGCVINVHVGLTNAEGKKVTSIQILPDRYCGEEWHLLVGDEKWQSGNFRVVEGKA